jgi:hypothetical protein
MRGTEVIPLWTRVELALAPRQVPPICVYCSLVRVSDAFALPFQVSSCGRRSHLSTSTLSPSDLLLGSLLLAMLAFDNDIADRGLRMQYYNQHDKIRLVGVVTIAMLVGLLAGGRRAHAQASDDSYARASDSPLAEPTAPPNAELRSIDASDAPAVSADATTVNGTDDSAAPPVSANSDVGYAPSGSATGSEEASGSDSKNGAVLEIPQVVNLPSDSTANAPADEASANLDDDDDDTAQSSQDGEDTAGNHDLAAIGSQVGTLEDYQNQENEAPPPGTIFFAPVVTATHLPPPPLFNPLPRTPSGVPMAGSPIIIPPTSSGPFPSTSPMLMGPRFGTFGSFPRVSAFPRVGAFPHAGLMGAHR